MFSILRKNKQGIHWLPTWLPRITMNLKNKKQNKTKTKTKNKNKNQTVHMQPYYPSITTLRIDLPLPYTHQTHRSHYALWFECALIWYFKTNNYRFTFCLSTNGDVSVYFDWSDNWVYAMIGYQRYLKFLYYRLHFTSSWLFVLTVNTITSAYEVLRYWYN